MGISKIDASDVIMDRYVMIPYNKDWGNKICKALVVDSSNGTSQELSFFISPEGQHWNSEALYQKYSSERMAIFECSDGRLASSYEDFKAWEVKLLTNPKATIFPAFTNRKPISYIKCYIAADGTIWRDETIYGEYLLWKNEHSSNIKDGMYYGVYGVATTFLEYARMHNAGYFAAQGLNLTEQYMDCVHGFLFESQEKANKYNAQLADTSSKSYYYRYQLPPSSKGILEGTVSE